MTIARWPSASGANNERKGETAKVAMCLFGFKIFVYPNPLPGDKIFDWSKLKQIADDILKHIQNEK